jgi:chromosome partitioning protein
MERLVQAWGDRVFHTVIRRTVKFSDSTVAGEPITSYASTSTGAEAYRQLAKEVLARWPEPRHDA